MFHQKTLQIYYLASANGALMNKTNLLLHIEPQDLTQGIYKNV